MRRSVVRRRGAQTCRAICTSVISRLIVAPCRSINGCRESRYSFKSTARSVGESLSKALTSSVSATLYVCTGSLFSLGINLVNCAERATLACGDLRRSTTTQVAGTSDEDFVCGAFSQDGSCVAAGSTDRAVRIWVLPNAGGDPELPIVMRGHSDTVNDIALLGENKAELRLMTASSDGTARVWDPRLSERDDQGKHPGPREILSLRRHTGNVNAIDTTRDGRLMMTAGSDGTVILWPAGAPPVKPKRKNLFDAI